VGDFFSLYVHIYTWQRCKRSFEVDISLVDFFLFFISMHCLSTFLLLHFVHYLHGNYHAHTNPLFKSLNVLPLPKLMQYSERQVMHSTVYTNIVVNNLQKFGILMMKRELTHNLGNENLLSIPQTRTELLKKSPFYSLPNSWNDLDDIKLRSTRTTFKIPFVIY
jgi:hypothetical protein